MKSPSLNKFTLFAAALFIISMAAYAVFFATPKYFEDFKSQPKDATHLIVVDVNPERADRDKMNGLQAFFLHLGGSSEAGVPPLEIRRSKKRLIARINRDDMGEEEIRRLIEEINAELDSIGLRHSSEVTKK